jgi:GTP cyclohydrolase I
MAVDSPASQDGVREFAVADPATVDNNAFVALEAGLRRVLGIYPTSPEVQADTPARVIRALYEMTEGYEVGPEAILASRFPAPGDDLVILKDIEFVSLCEHHLMPFSGQAHIAYVPDTHVVGLSKLARLVDCYARRFQMQERLCHEIATAIMEHVSAKGAACVIEATHGCLSCRGARKSRATFITSAMFGLFRENGELRREFFAAIQLTHSRI